MTLVAVLGFESYYYTELNLNLASQKEKSIDFCLLPFLTGVRLYESSKAFANHF